jgi:hypothetical protein
MSDDGEHPLLSYLWKSFIAGAFHEAHYVSLFLPGVGSLANYHTYRSNAIEGGLTYDAQADGSYTAYHNFSFVSTKTIQAGEEIFVGDSLLTSRSDRVEGHLWDPWRDYPKHHDYQRAQDIVNGLTLLQSNHPEWTEMQWMDILYRTKKEMMVSNEDQIVQSLLPETLQELLLMKDEGVANQGMQKRDLKWLQQNGYCLDTLREGRSTLPNAGRGAFATRPILKGDIILPVPIILVNISVFSMEHRSPLGANHSVQLLGNYCFSHPKAMDDSFLLCPLTQITLINHPPTNRTQTINAALQWGRSRYKHQRSTSSSKTNRQLNDDLNWMLRKSIPEIQALFRQSSQNSNAPLFMELIALEDIKEGSEIFLDYSQQWYDSFQAKSKLISQSSKPQDISPIDKNSNVRLSNDLPFHISYQCRMDPFTGELLESNLHQEIDLKLLRSLAKLIFRGNEHVMWYPCRVIGSKDNGNTLQVEVYSKQSRELRKIGRHRSLPREDIRLVPSEYQSRQHHPYSFRHFIPLPTSLFPPRWRKDYISSQSLRLGIPDNGLDIGPTEYSLQRSLHEQNLRQVKCGTYVAPSTIPNAGFSQYTAISYPTAGLTIVSFYRNSFLFVMAISI